MNNKSTNICCLVFVFLFCCISTSAFAQIALDARVEYESWNSGINGKTSAIFYGVGGSKVINNKWSVSGGLVKGKHTFRNSNVESASRQDFDIVAAYQLLRTVRIYGGYRLITIDYEHKTSPTRSFKDATHGLGIGVAAFHRIYSKLFAYGRVGISALKSSVKYNSDAPDDKGTGIGSGFEVGFIYQILPMTNAGFSVKQQNTVINYETDGISTQDTSSKWKHDYLRIGLSLSHSF